MKYKTLIYVSGQFNHNDHNISYFDAYIGVVKKWLEVLVGFGTWTSNDKAARNTYE